MNQLRSITTAKEDSELDSELPLELVEGEFDHLSTSFQELVDTLIEYWVAGGELALMGDQ